MLISGARIFEHAVRQIIWVGVLVFFYLVVDFVGFLIQMGGGGVSPRECGVNSIERWSSLVVF